MYKVPKSKADAPEGRFEFELPDSDDTFTMPLLEFITGEQLGLAAKVDPTDGAEFGRENVQALYDLLESLAGTSLRVLAADQLAALWEAYVEASGVKPGESDSSATSSQSTPKKSSSRSSSKANDSETPALVA